MSTTIAFIKKTLFQLKKNLTQKFAIAKGQFIHKVDSLTTSRKLNEKSFNQAHSRSLQFINGIQ